MTSLKQLSENERRVLATGLVLAGDYLKGGAPHEEHMNITAYIVNLVAKLDLGTEFSKALAETVDIGVALRALLRELR